ncbi:hypothetical protein DDB_G0268518 [Dictyostelium discoideum AX4]|uniref:Ribosome recycling factor domain-containing protein n=1 Tax=Dictyostelium discoideum TaxID=44689 RepID=Q55G90_DICDI|nr:hypothetical protein DDB_G0268518 [Dictyostelium discoideum AX4]EAL73712.1 hypothetical protein DDB_G0268518 [Dictyostelium discoideum AX4]|eukprot:XP_647294.1 hypothetical protein DDB_G0268518 [Dictyostelium discoideum AX4]
MIRGINRFSGCFVRSIGNNSNQQQQTYRGIISVAKTTTTSSFQRRSPFSIFNENSVMTLRAKKSGGGGGGKSNSKDDEVFTPWKQVDISSVSSQGDKTIEYVSRELGNIRFGRVGPELLERINVETPSGNLLLPHMAMITIKDSLTLNITLYDSSLLSNVERALTNSGLGLNPQTFDTTIRVSLPKPTQDLRQKLIKQVNTISEDAKVSIRRHRKDGMDILKRYKLTKDDEKTLEKNIQKITDDYIKSITKITETKLKEINSN